MKTILLNRQCLLRSISTAIISCWVTSLFVASLANAQEPPQYLVTTMENGQGETFRPTDINNAGLVTLGKYSNPHLFVDVPNTPGLMYDINDLPRAMWIDLETDEVWDPTDPEFPWIADSATGINESNQIVGTAYVSNGPGRVYVLEDPLGPNPVFKLLPEFGDGVRGNAINDDGVVVGTAEGQIVVFDPRTLPDPYTPVGISAPVDLGGGLAEAQEINIHGDIVTPTGHIVSPAGFHPDESFNYEQAAVYYYEGYLFYGINDSRQISGSRPSTGRGRNRQSGGTVRFQYDPDATNQDDRLVADALLGDSGVPYFCGLNEFGDVAFDNNRAYVYLESRETPGPYALDQHVVFASPDDEAKWMASSRAQPNGINDQGQIIVRGSGASGFILTRIVPGPGISVSPTDGLTTTESGGQDSFDVVLDIAPTANVTIGISSSNSDEGTVDVASLTFTSDNWDTPQQVTITGQGDGQPDGNDVAYTIVTAPAISTDPDSDYNGLDAEDVQVTNLDPPSGGSETYSSLDENPDSDPPIDIPDNNLAGISSTILVGDHTIKGLSVSLNIDHPRPSDLEVYLFDPDNASVQLSNVSGDNTVDLSDIDVTNSLGFWTILVIDDRKKKTGTLLDWSITVDY